MGRISLVKEAEVTGGKGLGLESQKTRVRILSVLASTQVPPSLCLGGGFEHS